MKPRIVTLHANISPTYAKQIESYCRIVNTVTVNMTDRTILKLNLHKRNHTFHKEKGNTPAVMAKVSMRFRGLALP